MFILKEIPDYFTWIIIFIALIGMIIIGWGSYTTSGIFGDLMALIVALGMGLSMVLVRLYKNVDFYIQMYILIESFICVILIYTPV